MSRLLGAFFTRAARAHAGRASSHSTPAACRPPNSADGSHLTSPLLPPPAVYQNPDGGVARPADVGLARKTGHGDRPESNGPAQRVEPRCRSRPSKSNPVFGFVVHGTGVRAHCPRRVRGVCSSPLSCWRLTGELAEQPEDSPVSTIIDWIEGAKEEEEERQLKRINTPHFMCQNS